MGRIRIFARNSLMKPTRRPANPCFSSGPCAKRPGWSPAALNGALLGRSHRSRPGLARLVEVIERSRAILQMPADYRLGIVPASDTGAVEMALWSLLGARGVDLCPGRVSARAGSPTSTKQLKLAGCAASCRRLTASLPDLSPGRSRPRRGLRVERHDLGRARPERRLDRSRPQRADDLRRDLGRVRDAAAVGQARCRHLVVAEGAGRRGGARHARAVAARRRAAGKLHAALAAAEALPADLERQADRGHLPRRDDQHAVDAVRRGRARTR